MLKLLNKLGREKSPLNSGWRPDALSHQRQEQDRMSSLDTYIYYSPVVAGANRQKKEREEGKKGERKEKSKRKGKKEKEEDQRKCSTYN